MKTMNNKFLKCKKCGGTSFGFKWEWKDKAELNRLLYCHDGFGFQMEDSIISCKTCGKQSEYEKEDFLELVEDIK